MYSDKNKSDGIFRLAYFLKQKSSLASLKSFSCFCSQMSALTYLPGPSPDKYCGHCRA